MDDAIVPKWDDAVARPLVVAAVKRKLHLFEPFKGILCKSDLISEGMVAACAAHPNFDPIKGMLYTSFVYMVVSRRLLDIRKSYAKSRHREQVVGSEQSHMESATDTESENDLLSWTRNTYRTICRNLQPSVRRPGRPGYTPAQKLVLIALQMRRNLSARGVELLLSQRADIRIAIGLDRVPDHCTVFRLRKSVAKFGVCM